VVTTTAEQAGPNQIILDAKLETPAPRPEVVLRPRLYERLDGGPRKLVVVSAAAGSGKSTLLGQWANTKPAQPLGWLSVDSADDDPTRFWRHMVAALRRLDPRIGERGLAALGAPGVGLIEVVLPLIIDDLREESVSGSLVLDDYHSISNQEIHESVSFFLDHRPADLRVVISSRTEPPFQLATRRARGQLQELTADDLRFTNEEIEQFLNRSLKLDVAHDDVRRLADSTEGWTAGVYLAALSLRGHQDRSALLDEFESGHRHVTDFLTSEVMPRLPEDMRVFMLQTSILERFNADLADTVSGRNDAMRLLREIERSNLFLMPLDGRREWFRYHHLFAELLRRELAASEPQSIAGLHRTASLWLRDHGFSGEAVEHALAADDIALASDLVATYWAPFAVTGQVHTVLEWFKRLGDDVVRADARLCLAMALIVQHLGRLDEMDSWLGLAEAIEAPGPQLDGIASIESGAAMGRGLMYHFQGDFSAGMALSETAVRLEPVTSPWRAFAALALGANSYWLGDRAKARQALLDAVAVGTDRNMAIPVVMAKGYLASLAFDEGRRDDASQSAHEALELAEEHAALEYTETLIAHVALAKILERDGDIEPAATHSDRAVLLGRRTRWPSWLAYALITKGSIEERRGESSAALKSVSEAQLLLAGARDPGVLGHLLTSIEQRIGLQRLTEHEDGGFTEALTDREIAVLNLLPSHLSLREIAGELFVSLNTVKSHTRAIYRKLGVSDRSSAVERARSIGIL